MYVTACNSCILQDFYIVFLKDHHPVDEETAFQSHIDLLSSLKGRSVEFINSLFLFG